MTTTPKLVIYPNSPVTARMEDGSQITCFLARDQNSGERWLGVHADTTHKQPPFTELVFICDGEQFFALNDENAALLRRLFPWLKPTPLEPASGAATTMQPSFGFGDRLGLATPGHIQALRSACPDQTIAPIFAQQSVRENARTGRTPQQVLDDAMWGVFQEGWQLPWGADADHLKHTSDLPPFVQAGYSFFTIDPGEHVDAMADKAPEETLKDKAASQPWAELDFTPTQPSELASIFQAFCHAEALGCEQENLSIAAWRAIAKYGRAIIHVTRMYRELLVLKPDGFDFEASVDETETPTSVLEHFYIANELKRLGVRFTSLAPRLPGRLEKGVDYIGDLAELDAELARHTTVMRSLGGYKLSLHSGSDKFNVYPLMARHAGRALHVKTAGTSYLEALRVSAKLDTPLFRRALELARQRYPIDRQSYHVSADENLLPDPQTLDDASLPALLEDFHVREALHVTFGSALAQFGAELKQLLMMHPSEYNQTLQNHFHRHLAPLAML